MLGQHIRVLLHILLVVGIVTSRLVVTFTATQDILFVLLMRGVSVVNVGVAIIITGKNVAAGSVEARGCRVYKPI